MSSEVQPPTQEGPWGNLGNRLQLRMIRVIDILSILAADFVVVIVGYGIIRLVSTLTEVHSKFFEVAKQISEGAFLLLYGILVFVDIFEFVKEEARVREG